MASQNATGHVLLRDSKRGPKYYAKFRVKGHQTTRLIGPAWTRRARPPAGYFTPAMAEVELRRIMDEAATAKPASAAVTFGQACDEWLRYSEHEKQVAEKTMITNRGAVRARLVPFFGRDTPLSDITTETIDAYRAAALVGDERIGRGKPLARNSVMRDLTNLSAIFKRAVRMKWLDSSPYDEAERVRYVASGDYNVLSVIELEAVARATTDLIAALVRVAGYTGLRFGELRSLRWQDVDFANANLHVRKNLPVGATQEKVPKGKRVRSLPLWDQAAGALDAVSRRGYLTRPDDLVFTETGGHLDYETTKDAFYAALDGAGLAHVREKQSPLTFHDLRHSFGTLAVQVYPVTDVQAYMGHEKIETTMRYVHHVPKVDAAAKGSAFVAAQMETVSPLCPQPVTSRASERNSAQLEAA
jgi:integrase